MAGCQRGIPLSDPIYSPHHHFCRVGVDDIDSFGNPFISVYCLLLQESEAKDPNASERHPFPGRWQDHQLGGV